MPRPALLDRPVRLNLTLPESLRARLDLHLFSDLEQRVPAGAYQEFLSSLIRRFFRERNLDLTPYGFPPGSVISLDPALIPELQRRLSSK